MDAKTGNTLMDAKTGNTIIDEILGKIEPGKQNLVSISRTLVGDNENLTFAVENRTVQPEPPKPLPRAESPRRAHVFHCAASFSGYLEKYKTDHTVVFIDVKEERVMAVMDDTAQTGFEVVHFDVIVHPLFGPWAGLLDSQRVPLRVFTDFLMRHRRSIAGGDTKSLLMTLSQVKVSKKITLQRGFGKHCINGIVCEMDIAGQSKSQDVEIPDSITIHVPLYLSTAAVDVEIDLTIDATDNEVVVSCASADLLEKRVQAFKEMALAIQSIDSVVVGYGYPAHESWDYLRTQR